MSNSNSNSNSDVHMATDVIWRGLGVNEVYREGSDRTSISDYLYPQWTRLPLVLDDPGREALTLSDAEMDILWTPYVSRIVSSGLAVGYEDRVIFYGGQVPQSWLSMLHELRGDALLAYARLLVSAVCMFSQSSVRVTWIEICEEPDKKLKGTALLTPQNHVMLVKSFKAHLQSRLADSADTVKIIGPCMSRLISKREYAQPYVSAFAGGNASLLTAWSLHVLEAGEDSQLYNEGSYCARTYVYREMSRDILFLKWVNRDIPVFVTKLGTRATRFSTGINYGRGAPETVEHALRIVESVINAVQAGAHMLLTWYTYSLNKSDNMSLFRLGGAKRPHLEALALINGTLPVNGYVCGKLSTSASASTSASFDGDETLCLAVVLENAFGFILGRAHQSDAMESRYAFELTNPSWKAETGSSDREATINMIAFPDYVSLTGVKYTLTVSSSGTLRASFQELPYNCLIFVRGDVYA